MVSLPSVMTGTVTVEGGVVTGGPVGGVPVAVAESLTLPQSRSACVTVYVAVQTSLAPDASVLDGQVGPLVSVPGTAGLVWASVTDTFVRVTLPMLVTKKE